METRPLTEYTIDELSAHSGVPTRTIRFYQSEGTLQRPEIRGRRAIYDDTHVARLQLIAELQQRGLQIKAIRELVGRIDRGEVVLTDWLGLEENLRQPWHDDAPMEVSQAGLRVQLSGAPEDTVEIALEAGLVEPAESDEEAFRIPSPELLRILLQMQDAGIDLRTTTSGIGIVQRHTRAMVDELVQHYRGRAGRGFGLSGSAADLDASLAQLRPLGSAVVRTVFAIEMQDALMRLLASGSVARLGGVRGEE